MATMTLKRYELADFERIISGGFLCTLEPNVLSIVQTLADQVGAPEYVRTPQFAKKDSTDQRGSDNGPRRDQGRRRNRRNQELSDEAWGAIRTFETTQLHKSEGIDKSIELIRKIINKITEKTYASLSEQLVEEFRNVMDNGTSDDKEKVANTLFTIASTNTLVNELCARLYAQLLPDFEFLRQPISSCLDTFSKSYRDIEWVNPDQDYDKFCSNNKKNLNRRSTAKFIIHLLKQSALDGCDVTKAVAELGSYLKTHMSNLEFEQEADITASQGKLEELLEIVHDMVSVDTTIIKELDGWSTLDAAIRTVSTTNVNEIPSLSHRARFKAMDILDLGR